jgi:hypothetical protein
MLWTVKNGDPVSQKLKQSNELCVQTVDSAFTTKWQEKWMI